MRSLFPLGLVVLLAAPAQALPHGTTDFELGWSRARVNSAVAERGVEIISDGPGFIACRNEDPAVEFERYEFLESATGVSQLWRVTIAYRLPYDEKAVALVNNTLERYLGDPTRVADSQPDPTDPNPLRSKLWVDAFTQVRFGARLHGARSEESDRMQVVWTDPRLQKQVDVRRKHKREATSTDGQH